MRRSVPGNHQLPAQLLQFRFAVGERNNPAIHQHLSQRRAAKFAGDQALGGLLGEWGGGGGAFGVHCHALLSLFGLNGVEESIKRFTDQRHLASGRVRVAVI